MLAVTFQEPGRVALEERPDPEPIQPDDAVIRVDATGVCGSDLHIYHGRVAEGLSDGAALFAGDVMGTGYHSIISAGLTPGDTCAVLGLGPVGLCAAMAAKASGAARVIAVDTVEDRLEQARAFGAEPVHL